MPEHYNFVATRLFLYTKEMLVTKERNVVISNKSTFLGGMSLFQFGFVRKSKWQ